MMRMQKKSALSTDKNDRRRGRPAGKNRTPLSLEERRARNAQYERERRNETADAMAQLADAARCDPQIANAELLATVISQLQRRGKRQLPQDIEDLRRANEKLESQIAVLINRLGPDNDLGSLEDSDNCDLDEQCDTSESNFQTMATKVRKESTKSQIRDHKGTGDSEFQIRQKEGKRSKKIRKTSKSNSVKRIALETDSDSESDLSSHSDWSASVKTEPIQYRLRNRSQKISEQSECTTSYASRTSESSNCGTSQSLKLHSDDSNQSDVFEHPVNLPNLALSTVSENEEFTEHYDDHTETAVLETLTEGEKRIINEWLDGSETLNAKPDHSENQVLKFLDFDDFLLDINA